MRFRAEIWPSTFVAHIFSEPPLSLSVTRDEDRSGASPGERIYDLAAEYQGSYSRTIAHFVNALRDVSPFETAPQDNLETLRLAVCGAERLRDELDSCIGCGVLWPAWSPDGTRIVFTLIENGARVLFTRTTDLVQKLQVAWTFWRTGALPHHDPGQVEGIDKDAVAKERRQADDEGGMSECRGWLP